MWPWAGASHVRSQWPSGSQIKPWASIVSGDQDLCAWIEVGSCMLIMSLPEVRVRMDRWPVRGRKQKPLQQADGVA